MENLCELLTEAINKTDDVHEVVEAIAEALKALKSCNTSAYNHAVDSFKELAYSIPLEDAEQIVRHMEPKGQCWSYNQIKDFITSQGITENCVNWYLVMNMVYNDYYNTAKAYNLHNDTEFYFSLAKDFIFDQDAEPFKVEKYFSDF